jgi:hypothetical protein
MGEVLIDITSCSSMELQAAHVEEGYGLTTRDMKKPDSGKIAVKVINHYGDEVTRVFAIQ